MKVHISTAAATLSIALSAACLGTASAHGTEDHNKTPAAPKTLSKDVHPWGREGDPKKVSRTVEIDMSDAMRFNPDKLVVKQGDTVKFVVKNGGQVMHEMVIGTEKDLKAHAELMKKHPGMEHEEPYMAHVGPGKKEEIVWQFTKPGEFMFGCLIPGHFEAGMVGKITVAANTSASSDVPGKPVR